ncbi:TPA: DEAD/DEAH box helicase family protein [Aeromonas hydrophila]|uniref:DEAD/DEAH box helicase n=2 Tax=Aeromonas TaxID=642 RepID=UPI001CCAFFC1|nr:DEAD/DEAH box helicase [Aeromonas hydrophila]UBQ51243.1 DEAD/DEAH box helicase family protein [Aeromonas hydrophila]HDI1212301.1 DEAD/DEAH box helicase family protein [Aeromonas hydrophila]
MNVNAVNYICARIANSDDFDHKYEKLCLTTSINRFNGSDSNEITIKEYHQLLKYSDFLSNSDDSLHRSLSLKIIASLYELYRNEPSCQLVIKSVLNKFGLFSAENKFVDQRLHLPVSIELSSNYRKINQKISNTSDIFTNAQFEIYNAIINNRHFSFSGPTSLGKSFLIKNTAIDLIKSVNNIVFILPTKALLEEYLIDIRRMLTDREISNINVTKAVSNFNKSSKNILIFTQERYNNFLFENSGTDITIDVLFIDEAHKLADRKNNRAITLFKVIRRTLDFYPNVRLVFSSPVISNPEMFFKTFNLNENAKSLVVRESPVTQNLYFSNLVNGVFKYFDTVKRETFEFSPKIKYNNGFELISSIGRLSHSNLIYISSKIECVKKCGHFIDYMIANGQLHETDDIDLIDEAKFISDFVHKDFILAKYLRYGIALHNGSLPTFIRKRIEDLYANKKIKYIFCTSTLLEGVNLPTQNVFIYPFTQSTLNDAEKCNLDFWNLAGRAGRYRNELSGNIFCIGEIEKIWDSVEIRAKESAGVDINDGFINLLSKHRKILNYLDGKTISPDKNIKEISALILSEVLNYKNNGELGSLLNGFSEKIRNQIIDSSLAHLVRKQISDIDPIAFSSNHTFDSDLQSRAHQYSRDPRNILKSYSREDVSKYIRTINEVYNIRSTDNSVDQLINVVYSWLMGSPLSVIIDNGIKYGKTVRDPETYRWVDFDQNNPVHLNQKIIETISCIENEVTFELESRCSHFYQLSKAVFGESAAGCNLAPLLEYGTMDMREAALQDYGFSRLAASEIIKKHIKCISFSNEGSKVIVNIPMLKEALRGDSFIRKELSWIAK